MTKWKDRAARSVRKRGVAGTALFAITSCKSHLVQLCIRCFTRNPWNPWYQFLDRRYDRRFAVDTAGIDLIADVQIDSANAYSPVPRLTFFRVLHHLDIDYSKFIFIDFGCGKGKVLLLASELPFKQIIGIEISSRLARVAEENLRSYRGMRRCNNFRVTCTDAREYTLPPEPAVYYFYDPFKREVMANVLENIRRSLARSPREVYIVYLDPNWRTLLDDSEFLTLMKQNSRYCIYKAARA